MQFDSTTLGWIAAVLVAAVGAFATGRFSIGSAKDALDKLPAVSEAAGYIVAGIQQFKETGKITDNNVAFDAAFTQLQRLFPDLDEGYLRTTIEGAYFLLKNQLGRGEPIEIYPDVDADPSYTIGHRGSIRQ